MADHPVDGFTLTRVGGWFGKNARGVLTFDVDHHIVIELGPGSGTRSVATLQKRECL